MIILLARTGLTAHAIWPACIPRRTQFATALPHVLEPSTVSVLIWIGITLESRVLAEVTTFGDRATRTVRPDRLAILVLPHLTCSLRP